MQKIDFAALEYNASFFKKILGETRLCAVVKNNAYGHGITHVARYLDGLVDCFAVGSAEEAKQIAFVRKDILILIPQNEKNTVAAINRGFILSVDSFSTLQTVERAAAKTGLKARIHIKIDSGMSRLGFSFDEIERLGNLIKNSTSVDVEGIYSHFYGDKTFQCEKQLNIFLSCAKYLEQALGKTVIKHIANSAGALLSKRYHLDMVRVGLGLYGYGEEFLKPVKTVYVKVISVKTVQANGVVGYGGKCVLKSATKIAVLNVGYAQGFNRSLVNGYVCIDGVKCKVLAVCMAMIIIDVNSLPVKVGDNVTLLGKGAELENDCVSIYELLCNLR